jgi:hypothetical protein
VLRVYLNNVDQAFKIGGEILTGSLHFPTYSKGLSVPKFVRLQIRNRSIVFIKQKNVLKAKEVEISANSSSKC